MYNRYIPQNDGSYSRRHMPDNSRPAPSPPQQEQHHPPECDQTPRPGPVRQEMGIGSFLKNILPKEFDTGDLMVILLLLLMAGDCQEDQNWAVLTLVLYLFL
jgi:hypothetical protein